MCLGTEENNENSRSGYAVSRNGSMQTWRRSMQLLTQPSGGWNSKPKLYYDRRSILVSGTHLRPVTTFFQLSLDSCVLVDVGRLL
jgi:hypothetical protein